MKELWLMIVSVALGAFGQIAFKYGAIQMAQNPGTTLLEKIKWPIVLGLVVYGLSTVLYIVALKKLDLSYAYPMVSLSYVFVFVTSHFLFNEPMNGLRIAGMICILLGVMLIAKS